MQVEESSRATLDRPVASNNHSENDNNNNNAMMIMPLQASRAMKESLRNLQDALRCSLCQQVYRDPQTLAACAHSFCRQCIDTHTINSWQCPYPGCGSSISTQTTGSYRKVNPTLATLVTSLEEIVDTLQRAPPEWWKAGGTDNVELLDHEIPLEGEEDDEDDDDESIDLQKMAEEAEAAEANNASMDSDED